VRTVILGLASDEEHHHDGDEGGEEGEDQARENLESGELLAEGMCPEFHGHDGGGSERASRGRHGCGCTDDTGVCRSRLLRADGGGLHKFRG